MPGSSHTQDPSTPAHRNSVRQVPRSARSPGQTPPSQTRAYYTTPSRSSARLHRFKGSPADIAALPVPSPASMNTSPPTRRRGGRRALTPAPDRDLVGGPATRLKRPRQDINYDEATSSDGGSEPEHDETTETDGSDQTDNDKRLSLATRSGTRSSARLRKAKSPTHSRLRASPHPTQKPRKVPRLPSGRRPTVQRRAGHESSPRLENATIPDWQGSLPHLVWVQVLTYASLAPDPFNVDAARLLRLGRLCKALLDPAITVLYRRPPVSSDQKLIGLITLLRRPPSRLMFNYRSRIRSLHLDLSVLSLAPNSYGSAQNLIQNLPQLTDVAIVHPLDRPPYRNLDATIRWHYPEDLFRGLEVAEDASEDLLDKTKPTRLTSWTWNERFMKPGTYVAGITSIRQIHLEPSFNSLRSVRFVNFQIPSVRAGGPARKSEAVVATLEAKDTEHAQLLADALAALPHLTHLAFESSTSANSDLLPLLPRSIKRLELINCWEITSDVFGSFLASHGHSLESLVLHSNQALNLAFLTTLGQACPRLTELRMNLLYYRHHEFLDDSDPFYDFLLLEDQIPHWPTRLQVLDMDNLRGWSANAANMFFQSLLDSSGNLRDLRHLSIKAMINIPWRERSGIRQGWQDKLSRVFLRPLVPPAPLTSLHHRAEKGVAKTQAPVSADNSYVVPSRRSSRLAVESTAAPAPLGNREGGASIDSDQHQSSSFTGNSEGPREWRRKVQEPGAHGLCELVDIVIDNQKPREQQFGMGDFLDEMDTSGSDGDAEWKGGRFQA